MMANNLKAMVEVQPVRALNVILHGLVVAPREMVVHTSITIAKMAAKSELKQKKLI